MESKLKPQAEMPTQRSLHGAKRRLITFLLVVLLAFFQVIPLSTGKAYAESPIQVFACEPEWAALAQEVGQNLVTVFSATTAQQDPHQVQARPSLIAKLRNADLVICTGAELEVGWLPMLLLQGANGRVQPGMPGYLMAADEVTKLGVPVQIDRAQGDVHAQGNPHIHTDPRNILPVAAKLAQRLAQIDSVHAETYQKQAQAFAQRWDTALVKWQNRAAPLKGVGVVTHHLYWIYLEAWLGLVDQGTLEPKPGVPPSASHLDGLLTRLKTHPAKMVIRSPYDAPQASAFLADRLNIPQVVLPGTVGGTPQAHDLFALFDDTLERLLKAINASNPHSENQKP